MIESHEVIDVLTSADLFYSLKHLRGESIERDVGSITLQLPSGPFELERPIYGHAQPGLAIRGVTVERMPKWDEIVYTGDRLQDNRENESLLVGMIPTNVISEQQGVMLAGGEHLSISNLLFTQSDTSSTDEKISGLQLGDPPRFVGAGAHLMMEAIGVSGYTGDSLVHLYGGESWSGRSDKLAEGINVILNGAGGNNFRSQYSQYSQSMAFHGGCAMLGAGLYNAWLKGSGWLYWNDGYCSLAQRQDLRLTGNCNVHAMRMHLKAKSEILLGTNGYLRASSSDGKEWSTRRYNENLVP